MQYGFGSGSVWGVSTANANPTPARFGALQECSVDFSFTTKELYGQYQFPLAVGRGTAKVTGKAKFAQLQGRIFNDLLFASTMATGMTQIADPENHAIPASPYTVTVTNSTTLLEDLGVTYAATGIPLTRVASAPATGQYSEAAGTYTFAAADTGLSVNIIYSYTVAASGQTLTVTNELLGTAPAIKMVMSQLYNSERWALTLNQCMSSKLSLQTKLEDFTQPEFDFSAFVDSSNTLGTLSMAELS